MNCPQETRKYYSNWTVYACDMLDPLSSGSQTYQFFRHYNKIYHLVYLFFRKGSELLNMFFY